MQLIEGFVHQTYDDAFFACVRVFSHGKDNGDQIVGYMEFSDGSHMTVYRDILGLYGYAKED